MSPEQRSAEPLTGATDQYALGVSLFEMLTGRGPFVGSPIDVHVAHLNEPAPSVREFRPEVPEAVAQAIARMLRKAPAERYPDLREPKRVFDRLVTDARSASAEIAKLSGVLAAPTASRVISAVRKAPTVPMAAASAPTKVRAADAGAPTVAVAAPPAPVAPAAPAPGQSRGVLWAAIVVGVLIIAGAVVLKPKLVTSPPSAPPPVVAGSTPTQGTGAGQPAAGDGALPAATPVTGVPAERGAGARSADREPAGTTGAAAPAGVPLPTATLQQRPADPAPAPANPAATVPSAPPEAARAVPVEPAPALADARAAARALVTMMNQRRARDLERLGDAGGGEAEARRTLERLVRDGDDFAAGFDRMASAPDAEGPAFVTEFVVEASWRSGGRNMAALYDVRVRLSRQGGVWVPEGYSVRAR